MTQGMGLSLLLLDVGRTVPLDVHLKCSLAQLSGGFPLEHPTISLSSREWQKGVYLLSLLSSWGA